MRALAAAALMAAALPACGGGSAPVTVARAPLVPSWPDVFEGTPAFYAVVRPQALKRDPLYGRFFDSLLRLAQARAETSGVTALEALAGSDEIIVGLTRREGAADDLAIVFRGVPASLDPARMTNASGKPLVRPLDERSRVPEFELLEPGQASSLFVLPGRTWLVTTGAARERARQVFVTPEGKPAPTVDADALAVVRFDADALGRRRLAPNLALLTKKLDDVTFTLGKGKGGLDVVLAYADDDRAAWSEAHVKQLLGALARDDQARFKFLEGATVRREGRRVVVNVKLPARLLEELPNASPKDL